MWRLLGLAVGVAIVGAAIVACSPGADIGYVEIKTVPVASVTQTALYHRFRKTRADQEGQRHPAAAGRHA